jgi:soluble cytochrome b562
MPTEEQLKQAEEIRAGVKHDDVTYLKRISDDMADIRKGFTKLFGYLDRAESQVPEEFRRLSMVFHDVHDVRNAYTEQGIPVPQYLDRVIELMNDRFKHAVEDLEKPGGHFYKMRKEVVNRGDFRYDHSVPLLAADDKHKESEK